MQEQAVVATREKEAALLEALKQVEPETSAFQASSGVGRSVAT